ncbi:DNA cytosine methyltransferase [Methylobacterium oryzihabitans]|uniref:DNA cytosine methyltransferase n=1 Tax=Methylobacterium oryzihabitans TaxID=2499852 RepID=UPI001FE49B0F|nr:DNA cytosine methyltransferase [Methylobacterium oryzihabitans]
MSLFSGAGGLDLGLEQAGWTCAYASDYDKTAAETLEASRAVALPQGGKAMAHAFIERADVRTLTAGTIRARAGLAKGNIELLAGGPPCQSWSSAGHQLGLDDPRGKLFDDFIRIADGLDPRWLLLENVRGLLTARGPDGVPGSALTHIRNKLLKVGFQTSVILLNAADYGVPQRRVRLFMVGFRSGDAPMAPAPTHAKAADVIGLKSWVTMREALESVGPLNPDEIIRPNERLAAELELIPPGQGVKSPGKAERTRPGGHWGYKQGAFVADLDMPARTVTANAQQDWIKDPRLGLRRLCPRECAALQTFPEGWPFHGRFTTQYKLIGNAVPPALAQVLGEGLIAAGEEIPASERKKFVDLMPLPPRLAYHVAYTTREEASNGNSRRSAPAKRVSRLSLTRLVS